MSEWTVTWEGERGMETSCDLASWLDCEVHWTVKWGALASWLGCTLSPGCEVVVGALASELSMLL